MGAFIAGLALILIVGRIFLFHLYNLPSASMEPTLSSGDVFLISTASYGSGPFTRLGRFLGLANAEAAQGPRRGDIVVFRNGHSPYVKRAIGLPGDIVAMVDGRLHLNGAAVETSEEAGNSPHCPYGPTCRILRETLPGGRSYMVMDIMENGPADNFAPVIVPADHYFMLGDNRDNSIDSRFPGMGLVSSGALIGPVLFRLPTR